MKKGILFIVCAPTGAGKTTLVNEAVKRIQRKGASLERVVTYTTRTKRTGEAGKLDYHFVSVEEFENKKRENFFLEVNTYNEKVYGTPAHFLTDLANGTSCIIIVDHKGMQKLHSLKPDAITIWISAPSLDVIKDRLIKRGVENHKHLTERLEIAKKEIESEKKRPHCLYVVVNDIFENAVVDLITVITNEMNK